MTTSGTQDANAATAESPSDQEPLGQYLARTGRLPVLQGFALAVQLLAELDALHRRGLGAGTISIDDLRISRTGRLLVAPRSETSQQGPRQPFPQQQAASDLLAAAAVVYELLTGTPPIAASAQVGKGTADAGGATKPVQARRAELPSSLDGVFARALAAQPESRYRSAAEFSAALQAAMPQPRWDRSLCVSRPVRSEPAARASAAETSRARPPRRTRQPLSALKTRRFGLVVACGTAATVLAVALYAGLGGSLPSSVSATSAASSLQGPEPAQDTGRMELAARVPAASSIEPHPVEAVPAGPDIAAQASTPRSATRIELGAAAPVEPRGPAAVSRVHANDALIHARRAAGSHRITRGKTERVSHSLPTGPEMACRHDFSMAPDLCMAFRCATSEFRQHPVCVRMHAEGARARAQLAESRGGP